MKYFVKKSEPIFDIMFIEADKRSEHHAKFKLSKLLIGIFAGALIVAVVLKITDENSSVEAKTRQQN